MKTFNAVATREGKWWVVDVDGVGVTQGRTADEAEEMAADLVHGMLQIPVDTFKVVVDFQVPGVAAGEVAAAREAQKYADAARKTAATKIRSALASILGAGLTKRDAARVLGVSPQRVSQLSGGTSVARLRSKVCGPTD